MNGADNGSPPALNSGDWETIYNVAADGNVGGGEYGGGYSNPGGVYSQRRFALQLRGTTHVGTGDFDVHLKIKLIEDDDDISAINANIIGEFGYSQPLETPLASESSTHQYFSPATGVDYVFQERPAPIISQVVGWTAINYLNVTVSGI